MHTHAVRASATVEAYLAHARRTCAALLAPANNPPLRLKAEIDVLDVGRLRSATLENFSRPDAHADKDRSFTLSFENRGLEPAVYLGVSERVYRAARKNLFAHGSTIKCVSSATTSEVVIEPVASASISFRADRTRELARILPRNVMMLGSTT